MPTFVDIPQDEGTPRQAPVARPAARPRFVEVPEPSITGFGGVEGDAWRFGHTMEGPPRPAEATISTEIGPSFAQKSAEDLLRGGKEIAQGGYNLVGNFFKALVGGASGITGGKFSEGQPATEFVEKLGDIGQFFGASGAPLTVPQQAAGLRRGLNIEPPRQAEVPRPGLALPPPRTEVPGPFTSTGQGAMPGPGATMERPQAPAAPQPPSSPIKPDVPLTGASARLAGEQAGRDLPPRAPGEGGRDPLSPERQAKQQASIDSFLDDAARGQPSQLASSFVTGDPSFPNRAMTRQYRQAVGRGQIPKSGRQLDLQDQQISTAIDTMIENKDRMQFRDERDPFGNAKQKPGRVPQNLNEFLQGVEQMETEVFKQYDQMTQGTGQRIELAPTAAKLREIAARPATEDFTPNIQREALLLADRLERRGSLSATEAQNTIQQMNAELRSFRKTGKASHEVFSHPTLMDSARDSLLETLNTTMTKALGDNRYQVLRLKYGALASIKANVANAVSKELSKTVPGFLHKTWTPVELLSLAAGTAHLGPWKGLAYPAAIEIGRQATRYLNNPNRAVAAMFNARARELAPRAPYLTEQLSARAGRALSDYGQSRLDRSIGQPYVGTAGM